MENILTIEKDGVETDFEIIDVIELNSKSYVVYSDGEMDANENPVINISRLVDNEDKIEIEEITDEEFAAVFKVVEKNMQEEGGNI